MTGTDAEERLLLTAHREHEMPARTNVRMREPSSLVARAIERQRLNVNVITRSAARFQNERSSRAPFDRHAIEEGRAEDVVRAHRVDRVQINNAVVTGDSIGGSGKGFIYTDSKQYDLVGTVIPMFGINNAFGKLFGPLGGGPAGGLFGITFQVKGPLDKPDFRINPMSALAPGAFRSLFEYRAKEQPRVE